MLSFYGMAESSMHIYDLQCEYQTAPLGIDTETPRFCWKLSDNAQIRGQRQTAYRLLIASSPALLDQDKGDIWDSGTISSDQSTLIAYKGKKLVSDQTYYWKVRAFDKDNKATGWSPTASFSTGLFSSSDWKSLWIKHPEAPAEQHIWFRKSFSLAQPAEKALFHIASMGYHELYVNGKKADDRVLAPALTRLDKRVLYVTYDITRLLENGSNTIAIWFGPGWARYNSPFVRTTVGNAVPAIAGTPANINIPIWEANVLTAGNTRLIGTDLLLTTANGKRLKRHP